LPMATKKKAKKASATAKKSAAKKKPAAKSPAKRTAAAKKSSSKKPAAKKSPAKKTAAATKKATATKKLAKAATKKPAAAAKKPAKAATKKAAATATKNAAATATKPAATATAKRKPFKRRDATGHLDPSYANDLRRKSREGNESDDDRAFLVGERANDALAEELGREFVETVTSGEDEGNELRDELVTEEQGGPFVTSTVGQEVAEGTDESNPADATREPFPKV
jgi:hypothetical protein